MNFVSLAARRSGNFGAPDQVVPQVFAGTEVLHEVRESLQTFCEEIEERVRRENAYGQYTPFLYVYNLRTDCTLGILRAWCVEEMRDGETDPIRTDVSFRVCQHERVCLGFGEVHPTAFGLAEIHDIIGQHVCISLPVLFRAGELSQDAGDWSTDVVPLLDVRVPWFLRLPDPSGVGPEGWRSQLLNSDWPRSHQNQVADEFLFTGHIERHMVGFGGY